MKVLEIIFPNNLGDIPLNKSTATNTVMWKHTIIFYFYFSFFWLTTFLIFFMQQNVLLV